MVTINVGCSSTAVKLRCRPPDSLIEANSCRDGGLCGRSCSPSSHRSGRCFTSSGTRSCPWWARDSPCPPFGRPVRSGCRAGGRCSRSSWQTSRIPGVVALGVEDAGLEAGVLWLRKAKGDRPDRVFLGHRGRFASGWRALESARIVSGRPSGAIPGSTRPPEPRTPGAFRGHGGDAHVGVTGPMKAGMDRTARSRRTCGIRDRRRDSFPGGRTPCGPGAFAHNGCVWTSLRNLFAPPRPNSR